MRSFRFELRSGDGKIGSRTILKINRGMVRQYLERYLLEGVVYQLRNDSGQKWALGLQARIGVHLDEAELELVVEHEVVAKYLERVHEPLRVELVAGGSDRINN